MCDLIFFSLDNKEEWLGCGEVGPGCQASLDFANNKWLMPPVFEHFWDFLPSPCTFPATHSEHLAIWRLPRLDTVLNHLSKLWCSRPHGKWHWEQTAALFWRMGHWQCPNLCAGEGWGYTPNQRWPVSPSGSLLLLHKPLVESRWELCIPAIVSSNLPRLPFLL